MEFIIEEYFGRPQESMMYKIRVEVDCLILVRIDAVAILLSDFLDMYRFLYRRLGGGAQRPNREIVSFRSCVRARGDCQVEMSLKRKTRRFPFSLFTTGGFPFSLGILPLLPSCYPALAGFIGIDSL